MSLIKRFTNSIGNLKSYGQLSRLKPGKSFLYLLLIFLVSYLVFSYRVVTEVNYFIQITRDQITEDVPDFELSNGSFKFYGEMPYIRGDDDLGFKFIIDTSKNADDLASQHNIINGFIITEEEMISYSYGRGDRLSFSSLPMEFNKEHLVNLLPNIKIFAWLFLFIWFFIRLGIKQLGILLLTLVAMIAAAIFNVRLSFRNNWNVAIYASTLPMLVHIVDALAGKPLGILQTLIYWGLAILYIFLGVNQISKEQRQGGPMQEGPQELDQVYN